LDELSFAAGNGLSGDEFEEVGEVVVSVETVPVDIAVHGEAAGDEMLGKGFVINSVNG
jgi:hypothetical protein